MGRWTYGQTDVVSIQDVRVRIQILSYSPRTFKVLQPRTFWDLPPFAFLSAAHNRHAEFYTLLCFQNYRHKYRYFSCTQPHTDKLIISFEHAERYICQEVGCVYRSIVPASPITTIKPFLRYSLLWDVIQRRLVVKFTTFRDNLSVPPRIVKQSRTLLENFAKYRLIIT